MNEQEDKCKQEDAASADAAPSAKGTTRKKKLRVILAVVLASALAEPARSVRSLEAIDALPTQTVVVQEGDSLWDIARRCGEAASSREVVDWIQERNGIEGGLIVPGQRLVVPVGGVD